MLDAIIIGHSHVGAVARNIAAGEYSRLSLLALNLRIPEDRNRFEQAMHGGVANSFKARGYFSMVGGNAHNVFSLIENPAPFDICIDSPPRDARFMLHHAFAEEILKSRLNGHLEILERIVRTLPNVTHICSPPPISDEAHLRRYPGVFRDQLHLGFTPKAIRMKVYNIECDIYRQKCAAIGAMFMAVPTQAIDHEGFLKPEYYNVDPTHGNKAYGALVLSQIVAALP